MWNSEFETKRKGIDGRGVDAEGQCRSTYVRNMSAFGKPQGAALTLPHFDHMEAIDNDCGLPEHPIYANYAKYLWTSHRRSGGIQIVNAHG